MLDGRRRATPILLEKFGAEYEQKDLSTTMSENRQTNAVAHPIFNL
jgi:hypothetical protein